MATLGEYIGAGSGTTKLLLHLNGNSTDSSGNGNTPTDVGATPVASGKFGGAYSFDGTNDYVSYADSASLSITGSIYVSAWIYLDKLPSTKGAPMMILSKDDRSDGKKRSYIFAIWNADAPSAGDSNSLLFAVYNSLGGSLITAINQIGADDVGKWIKVSAMIDLSGTPTGVFYKNGSAVATVVQQTTVTTIADTNEPFILGAGRYGASFERFFEGDIDEVVLENRIWSASMEKKQYTYEKGGFATL